MIKEIKKEFLLAQKECNPDKKLRNLKKIRKKLMMIIINNNCSHEEKKEAKIFLLSIPLFSN